MLFIYVLLQGLQTSICNEDFMKYMTFKIPEDHPITSRNYELKFLKLKKELGITRAVVESTSVVAPRYPWHSTEEDFKK